MYYWATLVSKSLILYIFFLLDLAAFVPACLV